MAKQESGGKRRASGGRKRVAIYLRVSTGEQSTANQRHELEAVAKHNGWEIVARFEDKGVSGAKGRDKRPGFDALLKGVTRREFDLVAAWSVDRLGRSLQHLVETLGDLNATSTDLYLHQQALDTSTPSGRALFQMCGVFAEFERAMIRERVNAGLARAKAEGVTLGRRKLEQRDASGRPLDTEGARKAAAIVALRAKGVGIRRIASELGVGVGTVMRLTKPAA
ncbi:recombinase family protein [Hyphomicrobium sp.]|jgi:DNA invertase Pin-like site-specific DNA recombinase|uniref:recombinase family protein n=1 Tax=Hyphomicrobium sp. TaxID=82 RepID=UPI003565C7FF